MASAGLLAFCFDKMMETWDDPDQQIHFPLPKILLSTGQINLDPVIGAIYPLAEWEDAFDHMEDCRSVKSVLRLDT